MADTTDQFARYHRQMLLAGIGEDGQRRLAEARVLIVGCGALGSAIAESLTRAGVGTLVIVDRDVVELTNLQRQVLFDESDAMEALPKAEAARKRLMQINSAIRVEPHVEDFNARTFERFIGDADLILDGLDNYQTRYLLNDIAVSRGLPLIHGGAVGSAGTSMAILPHPRRRESQSRSRVQWEAEQSTPCLRCIFPDPPPPGIAATCDTAGVLGPIVQIIAAHQVLQAIKLITGNIAAIDRTLLSIDLWTSSQQRISLPPPDEPCPCCGQGNFAYLKASAADMATSLCGQDAVQVDPLHNGKAPAMIDLDTLAARLRPHGSFAHNGFVLRGQFADERGESNGPIELTLFPTGRAILKGVKRPEHARSLYARYLGS